MPKGSIEVGHIDGARWPLIEVYYEPEAKIGGDVIWVNHLNDMQFGIPAEFAEEFCDAIMGAAEQIREHFGKGK